MKKIVEWLKKSNKYKWEFKDSGVTIAGICVEHLIRIAL